MVEKRFTHLHVHSEYSLLDGSLRIKDLVEKAASLGMDSVALTDHGVMYGIIEFYKTARNAGIKPIIGCEVYQAPGSRFDKQATKKSKEDISHHLTLLAKDKKGYRNLMELVSLGFLEGFYYKPRIDLELLKRYSEGLIALSGCISGKIPKLIIAGDIEEAEKAIKEYREIFGEQDFYLEMQDSGIPEQKKVNKNLKVLSEKLDVPLVCTNDVHYLNREDNRSHDVLLCIQTGSTINDIERLKFPTEEYYFKEYDQMAELFKDCPQALENTIRIAQRCNLEIDLGLELLPPFRVPAGHTPDTYLEELCREGIGYRYRDMTPGIESRLQRELKVIRKMGFAEYFLIVWDFVKFAKNNDIRVGPGRGSAAGSIVSYLLNITDIEPLKYGLLFERFLNEERKSMPDIDIDFCYEKRDKVIKYVTEKYGEKRVAQLITFGTMAARQAIRDAGRVLEVPYAEVDKIAKMIPMELNATIKNTLSLVPEFREAYDNEPKVKEIIETAMSLEGMVRQDSVHAAGIVISSEDLYNYTPIQKEGDSDIVTQYKMEDIQDIGLLKMDFLGLKTLSLIDKTLFLIEKNKGIKEDMSEIDLDDKKTFKMLSEGECLGVFQLESSGMRELVINLKPNRFEDLVALLALYRPGPLQSGMVNDFVDAKNKNKKIRYLHPSLEPVLESTYGIILYQEQIMEAASKLAGFSMAEADILRSAISKKKRKLLVKQKNKFIKGAEKTGVIDANTAEKIFELISHFAEYGFNKSHSTAYAMISYQTAYLKANYPVEFMAAILSIRMGSQEKVAQYVNETKRLQIIVRPPDINQSFSDFTVIEESIRFGLSAIKNVGTNVIEGIIAERKENGKFSDFLDFCKRVPSSVLNKKTIESLIKSGCFDSLGQSRKYLLSSYEKIIEEVLKNKRDQEIGQFSLFDSNQGGKSEVFSSIDLDESLQKQEFKAKELLNFEKEMLGLYISGHPLEEYSDSLNGLLSIERLNEESDKSLHVIGGIISKITPIFTKNGQNMIFLNLEDMTSSIEVIVFPSILEKYKDLISEDRVIKIKGRLDRKEDQCKFIAQEVFEASTPLKEDLFRVSETREKEIGIEKKDLDRLILNIRKEDLSKELINRFYDIISSRSGNTHIEIRIVSGDNGDAEKSYTLPGDFKVKADKGFFKELEKGLTGKVTWESKL